MTSLPAVLWRVKLATKGVPKRYAEEDCTHGTFKDVLFNGSKGPNITFNRFRFNEKLGTITTVANTKTPLSLADNKRFYLNKFTSLGYGHPDAHGEQLGDIISLKGGMIHNTQDKIPSRLLRPVKESPPLDDDHCEDDVLDILVDLIDGKIICSDDEDDTPDYSPPPPPSKKQKLGDFMMTAEELQCFRKYDQPLLFHN